MFGKEKKAEDKKKETALKREENRKKSGVKHKKPKQKQAGNGNLSCLFGLGSAAVLAGCIAYAFVRRGEAPRDHRRYYDYFFDTGRIRNLFGNYRISGERTQLSDV